MFEISAEIRRESYRVHVCVMQKFHHETQLTPLYSAKGISVAYQALKYEIVHFT